MVDTIIEGLAGRPKATIKINQVTQQMSTRPSRFWMSPEPLMSIILSLKDYDDHSSHEDLRSRLIGPLGYHSYETHGFCRKGQGSHECWGLETQTSSPADLFIHIAVVVADTQSHSIQFWIFPKNDSFNIWFNIALPKIPFKKLFNSRKLLLIQSKR